MIGTKVLEERKSKFNGELKVVRSLGFGTYIQSNGLTQSGGIVETIWKQTLKKIRRKRQNIKDILILGLGGGTVAKLVKKYWPEAKITGVDIDPIMVEFGKKYLGLDKVSIEIKIVDVYDFMSKISKQKSFDLVIVDLYNGDKFPEKFGTENYIQLVRTILRSGGIAIFNRLYYGDKRREAVKFGGKLQKSFSHVDWYYPEANLMFLCSL